MKVLAIDLGASSGRGIVGRFDGSRLALDEIHRFSNDPVNVCGRWHWDILRIFFEIKNALLKCAQSDDRDIVSLGIDTWGVDYGLLDKNGKLLGNPVHYRDERTVGIREYADERVPLSEIYGIAGIQHMEFNTLFQLMAELKNDPTALDSACRLLNTPDLLNYFLTGEMHNEYTISSTGSLIDANTGDWAYELIERCGIKRSLFGKLYKPGDVVGSLLPEISSELGGKVSAKVVHVPAHDTASAVVAVPAKDEDFIYISSGTWSLLGTELNKPVLTEEAMRSGFTNEGGAENKIRFLTNICGLWLEQESRRQWAREGKKFSYDELSSAAESAAPLRSIITPDDPLFTAPGDMPGRIAQFCRETDQPVPETVGEVVRCIFDSLALTYRRAVSYIDAQRGKRSASINIVGGGTKEKQLCRYTADACGCVVYAGPTEATAIGNLATQLIAAGELANVAEAREMIRGSFEIECYEPHNTEVWDEAYDRYLKIRELRGL